MGGMALDSMLAGGGQAGPAMAHFAPRAKRVIFLYMAGGPSQLETFDFQTSAQSYAWRTDAELFDGG